VWPGVPIEVTAGASYVSQAYFVTVSSLPAAFFCSLA
jgi:hypothetical protein